MISVLIPVRNGGEEFRRCLEAIARQQVDDEVEIVVVDSASTDGTADLARSFGARVEVIAASEFNHGGTRNRLGELAGGETLVYTVHDAYAEDEHWLARLTDPLREDPELAGVYARQLPHLDARPPERFFLDFVYGPERRLQRVAGRDELSMKTTLFSNVSSAIRRSVWEQYRFPDDIILSEDQDFSARVLLDGHSLLYEPQAIVRHSHPYTIPAAFKRFFESGVSAERAYLAGQRPSSRVLRKEAVRYGREELAWMSRNGYARWIPYTVVYELSKYAALQLGVRHRSLPVSLKRRFSAQAAYWDRPNAAAR